MGINGSNPDDERRYRLDIFIKWLKERASENTSLLSALIKHIIPWLLWKYGALSVTPSLVGSS